MGSSRHAWHPGTPEDMGARYFRIDGDGELRELEPADVIAALDAGEPAAPAKSEPGGYWSPWLEWPEGEDIECPLPPGTRVKIERGDGVVFDIADAASVEWVGNAGTLRIRRFSYHSRDDLGWLDIGDWTPPAELWADDCPVRLEWAADIGHEVRTGFERLEDWRGVHHVRLVAREKGR